MRLATTIGIPAIVAVILGFLAHRLAASRDLANRKREARLKALEAAYIRLANSSNRAVLTNELKDDLETFVAEIQLYGTPRQIVLMTEIVERFTKPGRVPYDAMLEDLRDTIRAELNLERVSGRVWWLRMNRGEDKNITTSNSTTESS